MHDVWHFTIKSLPLRFLFVRNVSALRLSSNCCDLLDVCNNTVYWYNVDLNQQPILIHLTHKSVFIRIRVKNQVGYKHNRAFIVNSFKTLLSSFSCFLNPDYKQRLYIEFRLHICITEFSLFAIIVNVSSSFYAKYKRTFNITTHHGHRLLRL